MLLKTKFIFALCLLFAPLCPGCAPRQPILIGFAGELTGRHADLSTAARDGAVLAVDTLNAQGGINGRQLELLIRDDRGDPAAARQVDAELAEAGVVAIIGHMTSEQTAAVFDQMNEAQVVLFSPTTSSTDFSGQADYFFRVMPDHRLTAEALATHIYTTRGIRRLTGIYDLGNRAYAETLWQSIQTEFAAHGGEIAQTFTFTAGETDLQDLMTEVTAQAPEGAVIIASAIDTALMVQYGRQQGLTAPLFISGWAATELFLEKGGRAIEGIEIAMRQSDQNPYPAFSDFVQQFAARYGRTPPYAAAFAYETVLVLAHALAETNGRAAGLPAALTAVKDFAGVQGLISLDAYGDVKRDVYIVTVKNRQFELIDIVSPAD